MKKGYVGLLACASGILIGLGISRLDLTGYLEKTQEQEYHPVERKVPESVESKLKDPKQCWLCGSDERSMMDYFRKFDDLGVICTNHWYVMDMHIHHIPVIGTDHSQIVKLPEIIHHTPFIASTQPALFWIFQLAFY